MGGKVAGFTMGALAVILLCVMTLQGPLSAGTATRSSPPVPPAVGDCGEVRRGALTIVDCSNPHTVEVTHAWRAGNAESEPIPTFAVCTDKARGYVGSAPSHEASAHRVGGWSLPLRYRAQMITGPGSTALMDWSWRVCVVTPLGPAPWRGYRGTVREMPATGPMAASLRACYTDREVLSVMVSCTVAHRGEVVATAPLLLGERIDRLGGADLGSCRALARRLTGAADPTFGGALRLVVLPEPGNVLGPLSADTGVYYTSEPATGWSICAIESALPQRLVDSVAGYGGRPLPLE